MGIERSHLVLVIFNFGKLVLESFSLSNGKNQIKSFLVFKRQSLNNLPMVEHTLRESFSLGVSSEFSSESERFSDGEESFNLKLLKKVPS